MSKKREELAEFRIKKNLTQEQAGEILGVVGDYISDCERGVRNPSSFLMLRMASLYGVPVEEIFLVVHGTKCG